MTFRSARLSCPMLTLKRLTVVPLLTEMGGFDGNIGVSVLAATNRSDVIDAATNPPPPEKSLLWIVSSVWVSSSERCLPAKGQTSFTSGNEEIRLTLLQNHLFFKHGLQIGAMLVCRWFATQPSLNSSYYANVFCVFANQIRKRLRFTYRLRTATFQPHFRWQWHVT
jgi:hypothetical protein